MPPRDHSFHGQNACRALFEHRPEAIHRVLLSEEAAPRFADLMKALAKRKRPYRVVAPEELEKVAGSRHHEGICIVADPIEQPSAADLLDGLGDRPGRYVFLDGVRNPHNIGALLRVSAHFGDGAIAALPGELPNVSGSVARIAEGGAEHVPVLQWPDPRRALARLAEHGFVAVAAEISGAPSVFETTLPRRAVFLVGGEHAGLSDSARDVARVAVTIPGTGDVESLNVTVACAILLAEHARRHPS
ncbi:MAG: rRNA methyltransferase [Sandaracinaceae bacterium]|nr:rRNA methyltransferase [Sandaracinaceae bacterium]